MKNTLDRLNLTVDMRKRVMKDLKNGKLTEKKLKGMVEFIDGMTGKHCLVNVGLYFEDQYILRFDIDDMNYRLVF